ncbi:polysaccharide deacetylase family protein [Salegentibacter sp. JZCK2]|uniref:polysaccharide deacetylase family protein n=1 Tax=Salegentibacter tibetensis TaxID=2873600 RepID=UPI001CC9B2E8|nr:polysaccharide deacetylase family protein [Salegentibacter tibetensis]MBZ9730070.1 polysaccharide deacetylase family protein [Salegentibacter tibetensis]
MKIRFAFIIFFFHFVFGITVSAQKNLSIAERLGYPSDAKLLIIHADDAGVSHSENIATMKGMDAGIVNSASIMVPCPWFPEIAAYARENAAEKDFGLHLTITSEWKDYKWGPTSSKNEVKSLINPYGYFHPLVDSVIVHSRANDVEKEISAQIEKALDFGIDVTHLDAHMGAVMSTPDFLEVYIRKGREYKVPVLLSRDIPSFKEIESRLELTPRDIITDYVYQANPEIYSNKGMKIYYEEILNDLQPGLSVILIHLALNNEEMMAVTKEHPDWGSQWRQDDLDFFTSNKARQLIEDNNIILVTWRELRDKIVRTE